MNILAASHKLCGSRTRAVAGLVFAAQYALCEVLLYHDAHGAHLNRILSTKRDDQQ